MSLLTSHLMSCKNGVLNWGEEVFGILISDLKKFHTFVIQGRHTKIFPPSKHHFSPPQIHSIIQKNRFIHTKNWILNIITQPTKKCNIVIHSFSIIFHHMVNYNKLQWRHIIWTLYYSVKKRENYIGVDFFRLLLLANFPAFPCC